MAKKKKSFDPLSGYVLTESKKIDNSIQYPEAGVSFQGYYKVPSGGGYLIKKQYPINFRYDDTGLTGSIQLGFVDIPQEGRTFYLKSLQFNTSVSAVDTGSSIAVRDTSAITLFKHRLLRSETITIVFEVPLRISSSFSFLIECGAMTINAISINGQGWEEEN